MDNQRNGCRVLTISASLEGAILFVERMKGLSESISTNEAPSSVHAPLSRASGPRIVPYTISNRYYSADIHFAAYELQTVHPGLFYLDHSPDYKPPPAIVFVWVDGEPYAKPVEELSKTMAMSAYEPEVSLAVRISRLGAKTASPIISTTANVNASNPEDENMDIDTTLMSFGFEYVDATREVSSRVGSECDPPGDVPSLPRVLDALSTIMWPSMQASSKSAEGNLIPAPAFDSASGRNISAKQQWERNSIMEELLSVSEISGISGLDSLTRSGGDDGGGSQANGDTDDELAGAPLSSHGFSGTNSATSKPTFGPSIITSSGTRTWSSFSSPAIGFSSVTDDTHGDISLSPTDIDMATPFGTQGPSFADEGPDLTSGSRRSADEPSGGPNGGTKTKVSMGFEDDFTVFVSAPPLASDAAAVPGRPSAGFPLDLSKAGFAAVSNEDAETEMEIPLSTAIGTGNSLGVAPDQPDKGCLTPASAQRGLSYHSLGSVSDFGGSDVDVEEKGVRQGYTALSDDGDEDADEKEEIWEDDDSEDEWEDADEDDDDDESDEKDMPTMDEVMEMAKRIFGKTPLPEDMGADHPLGFESAASAFSSRSIFAAASSAVESSRKASTPGPELGGTKSPSISNSTPTVNPKRKDITPSSLSSPSTSSEKPRVKETEPSKSQPIIGQSARANSGPDPAMLERMRRLGSMAAMSDIQFGMAAMRERSVADANSSTKAPDRPVFGPPRPHGASSKDRGNTDSEGEDSDIPPFDLTRVLHSLQAVRGEITGMDNEEERRRMAAKVALGFVYGMDMKGEGSGLGGKVVKKGRS